MRRTRLLPIVAFGLLAAAILEAGPAAAQNRAAEPGSEAVRLHYADLAGSGVHRDSPAEAGTLSMIFREATVSVPVAGSGTPDLWFAGLATRDLSLGFSGFSPALSPLLVSELYSKTVFLGLYRQVAPDRAFLAVLAAGTFADAEHADVPLSTGGFAVWRFNTAPHERWGVGVSATNDLGDPGLVPLVEYARWTSRWTANLRLPLEGDVRFWLLDWVSLGGQWLVKGGDYHVTAEHASVDRARVTEGSLGAVFALGRRTGPQLELSAGRTLFQRYRALWDGNEVEAFNFAPGDYRSAVVSWRF